MFIFRQSKDLQEECSKRQALLRVGEEELLTRKQEFDEIVRQEVEKSEKIFYPI